MAVLNRTFRFAAFEFDPRSGELRKRGVKIKLQDQPSQVLLLLLERAGEIVSREEIRHRLWPENTFVEFENAISSAVRKIRGALNDNPETPRFVETVARQGYRFVCPIANGYIDASVITESTHPETENSPEGDIDDRAEPDSGVPQIASVRTSAGPSVATRITQRLHLHRWRAVAIIVITFIAGLFVGRYGDLPPDENPPDKNPLSNANFSRFPDFPGDKSEASISPDGRFIAFRADRDGRADIWVNQVGTAQFVNLTRDQPEDPFLPIQNLGFSHDGSQIWLAGYRPNHRLRLLPIIGGTPRPFLRDHAANLAFSPDGSRLVFHTYDPGDPMFVADATGANARQIFRLGPGGHNHFPIWSADSRWIYFVSGPWESLDMDLWRIRPDGGRPERLTHHNADVRWPAPISAQTVLYVAPQQDGSGPWLWALDIKTGRSQRVSIGLEHYTSVAASIERRRLVATVSNTTAGLWSVPILQSVASEADVRPVSVPSARALAPRFAGNSLFYLSSQGTGDGLWRLQDRRGFEIWKGAEGPLLVPPAISPDARLAAIVLRNRGKLRLNLISTDGAEFQPLTEKLDVRGAPCWSPDGKWILTGGQDDSGPGLFKVPLDGKAPLRLAAKPGLNPVWSPDGSMIVYAGTTMSRFAPLLSIRADGTPIDLPPIGVGAGRGINQPHHRFSPDGKSLIYLKGLDPAQDFWVLDLATKKTKLLARLGHGNSMSFDITPDGKQLVFDRIRENSDIVLIELPK